MPYQIRGALKILHWSFLSRSMLNDFICWCSSEREDVLGYSESLFWTVQRDYFGSYVQ